MNSLKEIGCWVHKEKNSIIAGIIFLCLGIGVGTYIAPHFYISPIFTCQHELDSQYHFVNPLLSCSTDQNIDVTQAADLQNQLQDSIQAHESNNDVTTVSLYFHDLNGGPHVQINPTQLFQPGSLLKLPLAISIYKEAEDDPSVLQQQLEYSSTSTDDAQYFAPKTVLTPGEYPVSQLVAQMLVNSDNNAANALANFVGRDAFTATYQHLGVVAPPTNGDNYTMTVQSYASFLTILYNGTYLTADDSEHLLGLLASSTFTNGLVAGVPSGTPVAHKFGERSFEGSELLELHDCGIVYAPNHPYLLCIMTEGYDYDLMAKTIADLSNVTYNYVE